MISFFFFPFFCEGVCGGGEGAQSLVCKERLGEKNNFSLKHTVPQGLCFSIFFLHE